MLLLLWSHWLVGFECVLLGLDRLLMGHLLLLLLATGSAREVVRGRG